MTDRNGLIELLAKFKNLPKVPSIEKVKELLLTLLMDRQIEIQKLALSCVLNLHNPVFNKYQKHLNNLLDDTLFRDEIVIFLQNNEKNVIEANDMPVLMPLVLRILFGRAQTVKTNSTKAGRKIAAIKSLNNLADNYVIQFLELTYGRFDFDKFNDSNGVVEKNDVNRKH